MSTPFRWFEKFGFVQVGVRRLEFIRDRMRQGDEQGESVISLTYDRSPSSITPASFAVLIIGFLAFKGAAIAYLGADAYVAAIHMLENGAFAERMGAFIMRPDVVSQGIAGQLTAIFA